jgi:hypothetical protein
MFRIWILVAFQVLIVAAFLVAIFQWESRNGSDRSRAIGWTALSAGIMGAAIDVAIVFGWFSTY